MKKTKGNRSNETMISVPTLRRLPLYLSFLKSIKNKESEFITAPKIAKELHIGPTQITKDFSYINIIGKTKIGYETSTLISVIEDFLGYHISIKAFLVGIGNLGMAIIKYNKFNQEGLEIIAGFDIEPKNIGRVINDIKIFNIDKFKEKFNETPVDIGIISVPTNQSQNIANTMIECGIKAIWNFSEIPISAPDNIIIENTSIDSGLAIIKWQLNKNKPLIYKNRIL
ncbi:MAG: redox-sensing transcriptional repressor Rex [Bacteroidales bacterium]|nr:redox-sensing transcriptional repressor Rex [Bacteroidales bacterium]